MEDLRTPDHNPHDTQSDPKQDRDDWEDWSDQDTDIYAMDERGQPLVTLPPPHTSVSKLAGKKMVATSETRQSKPRPSFKVQRLKSRKRQQAQNARAGIKLITDMTKFRKGPQHVAQLVKPAPADVDERVGKFVDANALRALEGEPSSASVGNWAWLKKKSPVSDNTKQKLPSNSVTESPAGQQMTPNGNKIVIGISLPEDDAARKAISPQTAVVGTPINALPISQPSQQQRPQQQKQARSAWSPDTDDEYSPPRHSRTTSSRYSQQSRFAGLGNAPPIPALPSYFKPKPKPSANEFDDDDDFTPVTLFEEDGGKSPASTVSRISPQTTRSRSGWWDHVKTPFFKKRFSPLDARSEIEKGTSPAADEWWKTTSEKSLPTQAQRLTPEVSASAPAPMAVQTRRTPSPVPTIREPTPTPSSSSRSSPHIPAATTSHETHAEKARVLAEENETPSEIPPPYEPAFNKAPIRYRAVFPSGHPLATQFPPSPGPVSPGLASTMSSQGAINMTEVPLTPADRLTPLPDRAAGAFVTGDHFATIKGGSPAARIERRRRRHEKEDFVARKVGGFWKGRGCLSGNGCYGRSGREGRKRRRICLGSCLGLLILIVLGVVLGVVLFRQAATRSAPVETRWLNLTDFPPIPTGLSTVVGPDNSENVVGCTQTTLWSCSLPPEQQKANEPYKGNQPRFIFQIQYDNNTRRLWDIPNGVPPTPTGTINTPAATGTPATASSATSSGVNGNGLMSEKNATFFGNNIPSNDENGGGLSRRDAVAYDVGFAPSPEPPSFQEMWFLGNTTDGIVSDEKAGEPTPFYVSFFSDLNSTAGPNMLQRRGTGNGISSGNSSSGAGGGDSTLTQLLPAPALNADGTGAPATLLPLPYQQPLRLYDRGLPTEHYGFYSYYNKTLYVQSITRGEDGGSDAPADRDGGSTEASSRYLIMWTQTRFVVKMWTRMSNTTRLLAGGGDATASLNETMPGTFPYPITAGLDTHGGDRDLKNSFYYGVEPDLTINRTDVGLIPNVMSFGGTFINNLNTADMSYGGVDGGTGGCKCSWINYVGAS